ncbi:MAG TPA: hypothetical protein VK762_16370 [Polyangiaceae bacterium]|jgi:hypothetical protein|nr:hypothetical protein [Polyangiaceae bacterium]
MPPVEEISSSLLLSDDSAGSLPGVEELSGSLLLEDPSTLQSDEPEALRADEPSGLHADDPTVVMLAQGGSPAAPGPEAPAPYRALLGMPELPTSTPPPNLGEFVPAAVPPSTATLRPPDTTPHAMSGASSSSMSAALPADGVPPPPEQMFEALHGFEAAQAHAAPAVGAASLQAPGDVPPAPQTSTATSPVAGDVEVTALPRGTLVVATDAIKGLWSTVKSAVGDESPEVRRRWFLPAIALAGLVVGVAVVAVIVSVARKGTDETAARVEPSAAVSAAPATPPSAAPEPQPAPVVAPAAPASAAFESVASTTPCKVSGKPRVVAPSAIVSAGVEVRAVGNDVALGFAPNEHQATAVRIDPSSLSLSSTVDAQSADSVRRVVPLSSADGSLSIAADADREGDALQGRRTVPLDPPLDIGAAGGKLVWARPGGAVGGTIWPLDGDGKVEALRGATDLGSTPPGSTTAIAMRFGGAIWMGMAAGHDALAAKGPLSRAPGLGDAVGSPAIAINDGVVVVAWADRASSTDSWSMRWVRFKAGEPVGEPGTFTPPAGGKGEQVMSPGIAAVPGGRFLLVWTDGPATRHDVRALTLSREGLPLGKPLDISSRSANAGQGQAAVNAARQGLVAFLESADSGFRVVATAITCGL